MYSISFCLVLILTVAITANNVTETHWKEFPSAATVPNFYWREYIPGTIPYDALKVGSGNRYIGQVNYARGNYPGTLFPNSINSIYIVSNIRNIIKTNIQILCTPEPKKFYWQTVDFNKPYVDQMKNAVRGGFQPEFDLFIGAVYDNSELKIGKVVSMEYGTRGLYIWQPNGQIKIIKQFDLLKFSPFKEMPGSNVTSKT